MSVRRDGRRVVLAGVLLGIFAATMAWIVLQVDNGRAAGADVAALDLLLALAWMAFPAVGAVIVWHRPGHAVGRLLVGMGAAGAALLVSGAWAVQAIRVEPGLPGGTAAAWVASWAAVPALGAAAFLPAIFPSGRIEARWLRRLAAAAFGAAAVLTAVQALAPEDVTGVPPSLEPIENPLGVAAIEFVAGPVTGLAIGVLVVFVTAGIVDLVRRYRRSSGELRQQLKWVATALAILPIGVVTFVVLEVAGLRDAAGFAAVFLQIALLVAVAGTIGVAVLQYRLYDLDRVVRKSLAITVLGAAVAALYGSVLAVFGVAFAGASNRVASVAGVVAVVLILQPLRDAVQRLVDRLVHGDLAEPLVVLGALGERLEAAMESDDVLGAIVGSVAQELRLPYVAVELATGPGAAVGTPTASSSRRFSIERHGEAIGALVVSEREGEVLRPQEERLLTELARQAGVVVDGLRLTNDLARARERAVRAREEERRRIRRDLHDGLGPVLAGLTLRSDVARDLLAHDPSAASGELDALKEGLRAAVVEVRRLVSDLRPAALDEMGLASAVRALAASIAGGHPQLSLDVDVQGPLPELAAAVEVAAYRIAGEAVTNVVRHAEASTCRVRLRTNGVLELTVEDDGRGFTEGEGDGIGVRSMHDRAAEVGGTCVVAARESGGTVVRVALPISVRT